MLRGADLERILSEPRIEGPDSSPLRQSILARPDLEEGRYWPEFVGTRGRWKPVAETSNLWSREAVQEAIVIVSGDFNSDLSKGFTKWGLKYHRTYLNKTFENLGFRPLMTHSGADPVTPVTFSSGT
ncbi:hypothetical protein NDU88_007562 [Pleurodeles waltl]|uniref:Endonuclease/exonuclease/phosphatase domain-containing protein n=1 Tax=Pleurodeles waltl TaxID=8319 RepID=A0AAV7LVT8_PLEWA|nr:hypothetical protein NDU88_007562 [Pleurodeles waltl]